jgi:hypothetical protein
LQVFALRVPLVVIGMYFGGLAGIIYVRALVGTAALPLNTNIVTKITGLTFLQQMRANVRSLTSTAAMAVALAAVSMSLRTPVTSTATIQRIVILVLTGAAVYCSTTITVWQLMGRPTGPETDVVSLLSTFRRLATRRQPALPKAA